ncbi:hypothetical protein MC7420_1707 [Coleofasciculus chthonoplastes PCC 7420]|uniref:Uncharacterized protein n=1 Tax=Coleofasciculus chthonoplastes PCC 7420 TaxID=118168 RepID=B4VMA8_9CYAN|nr:hypothetical protein MC7420_1707 [Coleofasciculus chthonoplastes PCC 7420]
MLALAKPSRTPSGSWVLIQTAPTQNCSIFITLDAVDQ